MGEIAPRILLVEDDKIFSDVLTNRFNASGASFVRVGSGEEAIKTLEHEQPFDVILLDVSLPDIDGFDILSRVRTVPAFSDIPVIVVSNFVKQNDLDWGKKMGVVQFIQKSSVMPGEIVGAAFRACGKEPQSVLPKNPV